MLLLFPLVLSVAAVVALVLGLCLALVLAVVFLFLAVGWLRILAVLIQGSWAVCQRDDS